MTIIKHSPDVQFEGDEDAPKPDAPIFIRGIYTAAPYGPAREHVWMLDWAKPGYRDRACNRHDIVDEKWIKSLPLTSTVGECRSLACQNRFKAAK